MLIYVHAAIKSGWIAQMDKQSVKRCHSEAGREQEKETCPDGSEGLFFSGKLSEYVTPVHQFISHPL